jgi:hypothetical protein
MPCRCAGSGNEANPFNTGSQARYTHRCADQNCDCPHPGYRTKEPTGGHRAEERTSVLGVAPEAGIDAGTTLAFQRLAVIFLRCVAARLDRNLALDCEAGTFSGNWLAEGLRGPDGADELGSG